MNAPLPAAQRDAMSARERRLRRAAIARRLIAAAPLEAARLDWDALDQAPDWLAFADPGLNALRVAAGAVLHAAELRLWIDAARIGSARAALGERAWRALQRLAPPAEACGLAADLTRLAPAPDLDDSLRRSGSGVLIAALPAGAIQDAARELFVPFQTVDLDCAIACGLVATALTLIETEHQP